MTAFFDFARGMNHYDDPNFTVGELFQRFFPGREDVIRLLMEPITFANGSTLEDPALAYSIVFSNFMSKGVYTFEGGTDRLIKLMHAELVRNGVDVRIKCSVDRILVDRQRRVAGIEIGGRQITLALRRLQRQSQLHDLQPRRRRSFRSPLCRRSPRRAAQQFQHAGLRGAQAWRNDR